jgi:hypothetical protein
MSLSIRSILLWLLSLSSSQAVDLPAGTMPEGWGVQLKGHCNSAQTLDQVKALGLTWVRHGFHWAAIEKEPGVYEYGD